METLQDYINAVRILLQDQVADYRYPDEDMKLALTLAFTECYRIRPDMFISFNPPNFVGASLATPVVVDPAYKVALIYYMAGWVQLRDDEATQDSRAAQFLAKFNSQLQTTAA